MTKKFTYHLPIAITFILILLVSCHNTTNDSEEVTLSSSNKIVSFFEAYQLLNKDSAKTIYVVSDFVCAACIEDGIYGVLNSNDIVMFDTNASSEVFDLLKQSNPIHIPIDSLYEVFGKFSNAYKFVVKDTILSIDTITN